MKRISFLALLSSLVLMLASCSNQQKTVTFVQPTAYPSAVVADYFPLAQGAYWIYEGDVKWQEGSNVIEKQMQWKMEVVDVVHRNGVTGYKMRGAPWDLEFFEAGRQPSDYSFIKVGASRFYQATDKEFARMADQSDGLFKLVYEGGLFLDTPLVDGEKFCDSMQITRDDSMYCWLVRVDEGAQLTGIRGVEAKAPLLQFRISQLTNPDSSAFDFAPGVGITRFQYVHHGSPSEVDVRLVEFHPGQ